jgi:hypothetical protein
LSAGRLRVQVPSGPPISNLTARLIPRVSAARSSAPTFQINRPEFSARSVVATHSAWDRGIAGATPAALTNFSLLLWSNISGIRLLNGTMQVRILPAAPLPGGVKVARRFVKPHGVGASPTLAAIFGRQADISWLHLSRKQDRHRRGRSITDAFRQTQP